ncbi:MAG: hypothetical protein R3C19_21305 [Planctomycetaceae bacterium]
MNSRQQWILLAVTALVCAGGCGLEPGGGAVVVPSVTVLPAELAGGATADVTETSASSSGSSSSGGPGTFAGRVVLQSAAPQLAPLFAAGADIKDKEVCAAAPVPNEKLIVAADGKGVANVFIYLQKAPSGSPPLVVPDEPLIFDQKNCRFLPHCLIIPTGQTVKVLSDDPIAHNTHSYPAKNQAVNSGVSPHDREGKLEIVYRRAEAVPFQVKCDFHTWMLAYHLPLDHSFAALTDENGNFEIPNLPAGTHDFTVWHEAAKGNFIERKLKVTVNAGETTQVEIPYTADKLDL